MKLISDQVTQAEVDIILRELAKLTHVAGDLVEFGCYVGTTSLFISEYLSKTGSKRAFHVYDSFAGLPDKLAQDQSPAGMQFKTGELGASKSEFIKNYRQAHLPLPAIHKGWFEELTPTDVPDKIAFAFLDGDYYSSIMSSLKLIWPRLSPGAVIVVDDYISNALPGAQKAVNEWLHLHPSKLRTEAGLAIIQR
jgi:O-methyltransferase